MSATFDLLTATKNAAWILNEADQKRFEEIYHAGAVRHEKTVKDCHWIHNADEGEEWCEDCAEKQIAKLLAENPKGDYSLDGGWRTESDHTPFCEGCDCQLSACLTYCGAESELKHFLDNGFDPKHDSECHAVDEVVNTIGWHPPDPRYTKGHEYKDAMERLYSLGKLARLTLEKHAS